MRVFQWSRTARMAAFLVLVSPAMAQQCPNAGFTEVLSTDIFCTELQWLKNRAVTGGCTSSTYCPGGAVTRGSMALFLYRLGKTLTPVNLGTVAYTTPGTPREDLAASPILCQTADYQVTNYPRRATFNSKVNVFNPDADVELVVDVMYSTNSGIPGSWISVVGSQTFQTLRAGGPVIDDVSMYPIGFTDLTVGSTYRFGIRIARQGGSGNPYVYCENRVSLTNSNGISAPFDEAERTGRAAQLPPQ